MNRLSYLFIPLLVIVTGCASHRAIVNESPAAPLSSYSTLEVRDVRSEIQAPEAIQAATEFPDMIVKGIQRYNEKNPQAPLFSAVTRQSGSAAGVLAMDCTVVSYEKGSRAKRYLIGFGAGRAYSTLQCSFSDKQTAVAVLDAGFEGDLSMGMFGGDARSTQEGVVKAIVQYLAGQR